jgi:hypothetical protein
MPRLHESCFVFPSDHRNPVQLDGLESVIVRLTDWREPELGKLVVSLYMNVWRFVPVTRKEEEPIRPTL